LIEVFKKELNMTNKDQPVYSFVRWRGLKEPFQQDNLTYVEAMELFKQEIETIKHIVLQDGLVSVAELMSFTGIMKGKTFIKKYDGRKALKEMQKEAI